MKSQVCRIPVQISMAGVQMPKSEARRLLPIEVKADRAGGSDVFERAMYQRS